MSVWWTDQWKLLTHKANNSLDNKKCSIKFHCAKPPHLGWPSSYASLILEMVNTAGHHGRHKLHLQTVASFSLVNLYLHAMVVGKGLQFGGQSNNLDQLIPEFPSSQAGISAYIQASASDLDIAAAWFLGSTSFVWDLQRNCDDTPKVIKPRIFPRDNVSMQKIEVGKFSGLLSRLGPL